MQQSRLSTSHPLRNQLRIISGGQTGADRAALDWAIGHQVPHGGWCPKGRRADDGPIPDCYDLDETPRRNYRQRTAWNVRDADATLIITLHKTLAGGSLYTAHRAKKLRRPWLHVFPNEPWRDELREFWKQHPIRTLNVAGPRASSAPGIEVFVQTVLSFFCQGRKSRDRRGTQGQPELRATDVLTSGLGLSPHPPKLPDSPGPHSRIER